MEERLGVRAEGGDRADKWYDFINIALHANFVTGCGFSLYFIYNFIRVG